MVFSGWRHIPDKQQILLPIKERRAFKEFLQKLQAEVEEKVCDHISANPALEANRENINYWDALESYAACDHNQYNDGQ